METLFGEELIKSIAFDEGEILRGIRRLYVPDWIELYPCYSIGRFYTEYGMPHPKYRFDIKPQAPGVEMRSAENMPFENETIKSMATIYLSNLK